MALLSRDGYVESASIHAYPIANRGGDYPFSRICTEYNTTQFLRNITDRSSYVLTKLTEQTSTTDATKFEFMLYGYYFQTDFKSICDSLPDEELGGKTVYAYIKVTSSTPNYASEIECLESVDPSDMIYDTVSYFCDIKFTTTEPSSISGAIYMKLFDVDSSENITIPDSYRQRFDDTLDWIDLTTLPTIS